MNKTFFFPIPSTTVSTLVPNYAVVNSVLSPIIPNSYTSSILYGPKLITYDSGIGESDLATHEINHYLRYKFLDKWIFTDFSNILKLLEVKNGNVIVVSADEAAKNDIAKDSEKNLIKKTDYIGNEILTLSKNLKILKSLIKKTKMKFYDLPHNERAVKKTQAKYIKKKLNELYKNQNKP